MSLKMMKIGNVIEYHGPRKSSRPKYGLIIHLKEIIGGYEVGVYFPNNSYVQTHSKYVDIVCK